jgi:acetyl esterase
VVTVDYRPAVDGTRHPVPVDDAHAAWLWLAGTGRPTSGPVGPGGAGTDLALSTAIRLSPADRAPPVSVACRDPAAPYAFVV